MEHLLLGWKPRHRHKQKRHFPTPSWGSARSRLGDVIKHVGEGHLITFAPTGAGKGVSVIIPNLLSYSGPVITIDPKGENFSVTARFRKETLGQNIYLLDPFHCVDDMTIERIGVERARLDPLDMVDLESPERDVHYTMLASILSNQSSSPGTDRKDDFWENEAMKLMAGAIGVSALKPLEDSKGVLNRKKSFSKFIDILYSDDVVFNLAVALDTAGSNIGDFAYKSIAAFLQKADKERSGVLSTAQAHLNPLVADVVQGSMRDSTFQMDEIKEGSNYSIYVVIPPDKLVSHSVLLKLWIAIFIHSVMTRVKAPEKRTLFLLDECAQLGYLDGLKKSVTLLRGYGMQVWMFFQDLTQLESIYGLDNEGIINNCSVLQVFGYSRRLAAAPVSEVIGGFTEEQFMALPKTDQIVSTGSGDPEILKSIKYYQDHAFDGRWDQNPLISTTSKLVSRQPFSSNIQKY